MQSEIVVSVRSHTRALNSADERILEENMYTPVGVDIYPPPTNPLQVHYVDHCSECSACCHRSAALVLEDIGNMALRATKYQHFFFKEGMLSDCRHCTDWNLRMSEMLEYHARVLLARVQENVPAMLSMTRQRSRVLRDLGYTVI